MPPLTLWRTVATRISDGDLGILAQLVLAERDRRIRLAERELATLKGK